MEDDTRNWYIYDLERIIYESVSLSDIMRVSGYDERLEKIYRDINKRFDDERRNLPPAPPPDANESETT